MRNYAVQGILDFEFCGLKNYSSNEICILVLQGTDNLRMFAKL